MVGRRVVVAGLLGGCAVNSTPDVNYHRDVRPIFEESCGSCHTEGGIGPFVMDFDPAAWADGPPDWAPAAVAAVSEGRMPPWMPEDDCHPIADARRLDPADKGLVEDWAKAGFAEGDPTQFVPRLAASAARERPELGAPDLTLRPEVGYRADVSKPDDYRCFVVDHTFETDAWVRGVTVLPDQAPIVHHVILYRLDAEYAADVVAWDAADEGPGYSCFGSPGTWDADTVAGWAPGQLPEVYDEGVARRIAAGSRLVIQVHYNVLNLTGEAQEDRTSVLLWTQPEVPLWQLYSVPLANSGIRIPAGKANVVEKDEFSFDFLPFDVTAIGVLPHMHQLGTSIKLDLVREVGGKSCVVDVPKWDFNWQQSYFFPSDQPIVVGASDRLKLTCTYDNSQANQPVVNGVQQEPRDVGWGDGSLDEMCLMYAHVLVPPGFL